MRFNNCKFIFQNFNRSYFITFMSTCYKFKGSLEKNLKLNQNLPRDAFHSSSIRELTFFFNT